MLCTLCAVQVDYAKGCHIYIGPSCESTFIRDCVDCTFTIACKQLRTRDCKNCNVYLYSKTDPIIESSSGMRFAPFNGAYAGQGQHFAAANLQPENNHWSNVYDFNKGDTAYPEPHWELLPRSQWKQWTVPSEAGQPPPENPVDPDSGMPPLACFVFVFYMSDRCVFCCFSFFV